MSRNSLESDKWHLVGVIIPYISEVIISFKKYILKELIDKMNDGDNYYFLSFRI